MSLVKHTAIESLAGRAGQDELIKDYRRVRAFTAALCQPLVTEDYVIQSMPDVSPTRWHLGHTTWFFETFVLKRACPDYRVVNPAYDYLFNSYYNAVGPMHCRDKRGLISRPTVAEIFDYRRVIDQRMLDLLAGADDRRGHEAAPIVRLGLHHEQQHQELLLTDIKHVFAQNPVYPVYQERADNGATPVTGAEWIHFPGGLGWIGHNGDGFAFDNEGPRHQRFLEPFLLASRPVTNGEYLMFIEDGGYEQPLLWLSEGWRLVKENGWTAPLYWNKDDGCWCSFTLSGVRKIEPAEPVCHISYFEADAYARWSGARLPDEAEWEIAAAGVPLTGNFVESRRLQPAPLAMASRGELRQVFGDVWEWTRSAYSPYPGYRTSADALGEYNGKFMCNQYVLRGGSCATSRSHIRPAYRNFFAPDKRWQFSGIRLAKDCL